MKIDNVDTNKEVLLIAEIGNNHEGSYSLAEEMIGRAAEAGAGAVKFQMIVPERLVSASQTKRVEQLKRFQLSYKEFKSLANVAKSENIIFLSTPFDLQSAIFLESLVPAYKIASGDITFFPLIKKIAKTGKPIILSSGMANLREVIHTRDFIYNIWDSQEIKSDLAVLHCVSSYPTLPHNADLLSIKSLEKLGVTVGYSDHTLGVEAAVLSVAVGARIIEKHFTIDKNYSDFHDHQLSADPIELKQLVERVREAGVMLGDGGKKNLECEQVNKTALRRSIVANMDLDKGTILEWEHLSWVRPAGGLPPGAENEILGRILKQPVKRGEMIFCKDVE